MRKPEIRTDSVPKLRQSNGSNFFSSGLRQKVDQLMNVDLARGIVDGSLLKPKQWEFLESHALTSTRATRSCSSSSGSSTT